MRKPWGWDGRIVDPQGVEGVNLIKVHRLRGRGVKGGGGKKEEIQLRVRPSSHTCNAAIHFNLYFKKH